ncbi:MBL fold metallo-hydrolase [candidate division KSB1 bacterium]|nr:MBL fold metallo-hydrolase [candidate division KSB1 bacterium]
MEFCVLASGSNGNAIYVGSRKSGAGILLDCGISRRQIQLRLTARNKSLEQINAIFISHEHVDHVVGLNVICKYYHLPIYLTRGTWQGLRNKSHLKNVQWLDYERPIQVADLTVESIPKSHDALEPIAFSISLNGTQLLYATDFGAPNAAIIQKIQTARVIILETNYDPQMLETGPYPEHLKRRIRSAQGHMSNFHAADLIRQYATPDLKYLILGHLSQNNNLPELAHREVLRVISQRIDLQPELRVASRFQAGELLTLDA